MLRRPLSAQPSSSCPRFFGEAARTGRVAEALELLEDSGFAERWRPIKQALLAIEAGSTLPLRRVAPEVRQATDKVLEIMLGETKLPDPRSRREAEPFVEAARRVRERWG